MSDEPTTGTAPLTELTRSYAAALNVFAAKLLPKDDWFACGHRAYARSRYPLTLSMLCANGLDYFARHAEQILVEIDEAEYQRKAADEWRPDDED